MTPLENLIKGTSKTPQLFAKMVGVSPQSLRVQLKSKNHLQFAYKYACKLGITRIYGTDQNCYVEVIIKKF